MDGPRVRSGAAEATVDILAWLGIDWDEGPFIQSADLEPYRAAMGILAAAGLVYPSTLSRSEIEEQAAAAAASAPQEGTQESRFPASLRPAVRPRTFDREDVNWRFAVPAGKVEFIDEFTGPQRHDPSETVGDFLVWTKRGQPSYQLAVVVDDHRQGVTDIVRGDDLLDSAARQLLLYRALGMSPEPRYTHLPLVRGADGKRLAKRHGDTRIESYRAAGVAPERIIGLIAAWSGVLDRRKPRPMGAQEFIERFDPATMPPEPVVFTPEDHAWLSAEPRP